MPKPTESRPDAPVVSCSTSSLFPDRHLTGSLVTVTTHGHTHCPHRRSRACHSMHRVEECPRLSLRPGYLAYCTANNIYLYVHQKRHQRTQRRTDPTQPDPRQRPCPDTSDAHPQPANRGHQRTRGGRSKKQEKKANNPKTPECHRRPRSQQTQARPSPKSQTLIIPALLLLPENLSTPFLAPTPVIVPPCPTRLDPTGIIHQGLAGEGAPRRLTNPVLLPGLLKVCNGLGGLERDGQKRAENGITPDIKNPNAMQMVINWRGESSPIWRDDQCRVVVEGNFFLLFVFFFSFFPAPMTFGSQTQDNPG